MSDPGSNAGLDEAALARKQQLTEDLARAKEAGWNNPIPFNYETVLGGQAAPDETRDSAVWLSDAAIYQWDDEFGDVGAPNPDLEKMLFADEHLQRAGGAIKALSFNVNLEGPEKVQPVRDVSTSASREYSHMLMQNSLRMQASTLSCWRTSSYVSTRRRHRFSRTVFLLS
jgi:ATP-dependent RNA helicase DDX3X